MGFFLSFPFFYSLLLNDWLLDKRRSRAVSGRSAPRPCWPHLAVLSAQTRPDALLRGRRDIYTESQRLIIKTSRLVGTEPPAPAGVRLSLPPCSTCVWSRHLCLRCPSLGLVPETTTFRNVGSQRLGSNKAALFAPFRSIVPSFGGCEEAVSVNANEKAAGTRR